MEAPTSAFNERPLLRRGLDWLHALWCFAISLKSCLRSRPGSSALVSRTRLPQADTVTLGEPADMGGPMSHSFPRDDETPMEKEQRHARERR
eukprot:2175234-Amphidinium_carterae.1